MCGRFVSTSSVADLVAVFDASPPDPDELPGASWNVAPTDDVAAVRVAGGTRRVEALHWGLVPWWAESPKVGSRMINARAETLATKGAFKAAFATRRNLVPADGFYEWAVVEGRARKQPYFVHPPDGGGYAFAALWEEWRGPERDGADHLRSTTIITTAANGPMAEIHDRMPVILPRTAWDEWLDPEVGDIAALARLLVPAEDGCTVLRPVGPDVGNVRHDRPDLVDRVDPTEAPAEAPAEATLPGMAP